jgi:hypothetical protein
VENGLLQEFGTHEELMALEGRYKYLYRLQTDALATPGSGAASELLRNKMTQIQNGTIKT